MSWDIFYNKQFVKLEQTNEFIPMILGGSNNCYESGRGKRDRRSRSWYSSGYVLNRNSDYPVFSATHSALMQNVNECINHYTDRCGVDQWYIDNKYTKDYVMENFGYMTALKIHGYCGLTTSQFLSFFQSGIKKAMTIEALDAIGVNLEFTVYEFGDYYKFSIPIPTECLGIIRTETQYHNTLAKLMEWYNKCIVTVKDSPNESKASIYLRFAGYWESISDRLANTRRKSRNRNWNYITKDKFFVLKNDSGYLKKYTRNGYRYSQSPEWGKAFETAKQAEAYKKQLVRKRKYGAIGWTVYQADRPYTFKHYTEA